MAPGSGVKSEYMKRYQQPRWDELAPCYRELLHYRLGRRLLEQAHAPWLWDAWAPAGSSDAASSASSGAGSLGASPASPRPLPAEPAAPGTPEDPSAEAPAKDTTHTGMDGGLREPGRTTTGVVLGVWHGRAPTLVLLLPTSSWFAEDRSPPRSEEGR